ncbi:hypothetical protein GOP47_0008775 [Adiantum capillus-veneris]|uniref:Uncharacterized protein n=1 Tax=Adiantum capillus-veneris TaxID=13818 RepID=A0A9D4UYZ1_ADICA|nr:hypothetical protein GOP47_0008775 [Adiantum capillus-veneris]
MKRRGESSSSHSQRDVDAYKPNIKAKQLFIRNLGKEMGRLSAIVEYMKPVQSGIENGRNVLILSTISKSVMVLSSTFLVEPRGDQRVVKNPNWLMDHGLIGKPKHGFKASRLA